MAGFATKGRAIGPFVGHAIVELPLVGILVASGASPIFEVEGKNLVGAAGSTLFMAVGAGDSDMSSGEGEPRGLVLGDGEGGAMEIDNRVAGFTTIVVWGGSKLIVVGILVAIGAGFKLNFVDGVFARGNVAFRAFYLYMLSFEWIARGVVFFHPEQRGFPTLHIVAF